MGSPHRLLYTNPEQLRKTGLGVLTDIRRYTNIELYIIGGKLMSDIENTSD
jgi:hypothetical protein